MTVGSVAAGAAAAATFSIRRGIRASSAAVPGRSDYWREPQHAQGEVLYAALGDSAGQSIGTEDPLAGYVGQLSRRIAARTGRSVAVANLCVSGARARDVVRDQLPALAALDRTPDVVTCVIGGNDVYFRTGEADFVSAYEELVAGLPADTVIGDIPCFRLWFWERRVLALNAHVHRLGHQAGFAVAGIHAATKAPGLVRHVRGLSPDMFHPNADGYARWADPLWDIIAERLGAETDVRRGP